MTVTSEPSSHCYSKLKRNRKSKRVGTPFKVKVSKRTYFKMKNKYPVFFVSLHKLLFQQQWETFKPLMWGSLVSKELHVHKGNISPNLMFYGLSHDNSFFLLAMSVSKVYENSSVFL